MSTRGPIALLALALTGCVGSTGSSLFTFEAAAAGPEDAAGGELSFVSPRGFDVRLHKAKLHVGALYLDAATPISGAGNTECIQPAVEDALVYVAEVTRELEVDALDPRPQAFPGLGDAVGERALAGELWLTHGDVDAPDSDYPVLEVAGVASRAGQQFPFEANLTIGRNRVPSVVDPSQPSAHPVCKERIVAPIPVSLTPVSGGSLLFRVDPRGWFTNVDFSLLAKTSGDPPLYRFRDDDDDPASFNLYLGLQAAAGVYGFSWQTSRKP